MPGATFLPFSCRFRCLAALLIVYFMTPCAASGQTNDAAQNSSSVAKPSEQTAIQKTAQAAAAVSTASLEADQQRQVGKIFYADGHVDIRYENTRLRADHVEYDSESQVATAKGDVQLDYMNQHIEADDGTYELRTGHGNFHNVRASFAIERKPTPTLLVSENPLYFEAAEVERLDESTYRIHKAWLTVCDPDRPTWKFYAPLATVQLHKTVHLDNGNFRVYSVPVLYLPYSSFPAERGRDTGFLIPDPGHSTQKGLIIGDAFYWAPFDWADLTIGASYYSIRGWAQRAILRMRPWENANLEVTYHEVEDRGLVQPTGPPINQGGIEDHVLFTALLPDNWRAVADLNQLSSITFRLAFDETYTQAVNSEVPNTAFLSNNFHGFSLDAVALGYKNFLSATPQTQIILRTAPELQFSSVDQAPFSRIPLYFALDAFTGAVHREENVTGFETPGFVSRSELAPSVTMPFHWGPWLSVTPSFTLRSTYYGGQQANGVFFGESFFRTTEEVSVDIRPPTIERIWQGRGSKWKHVIEPDIVYRYVNGVNDYARFIRFDEDETLTDTNELEYGITQRLYRRTASGEAQEIISWRLVQKYYFDPTFGGALVTGQRNVFQATDSLTPFAFAGSPRNFAPVISDFRLMPGKRWDLQFRFDYDPKLARMNAVGTLVKFKPYKESFFTLAHFSVDNLPTPLNQNPPGFTFVERSNQVRALIGYGDINRRGWNAAFGASFDIAQGVFQNQIAQFTYNTSCCGVGFEYRRLSFGTIRNENQYRIVINIANLGSAGNFRRQEKIF
jgi:LPS-assembly protein